MARERNSKWNIFRKKKMKIKRNVEMWARERKSNANRNEKAVWIISFHVAAVLCAIHTGSTCKRYLNVPLTTSVSVYKANSFKVPPFVVCPEFITRADEDFETDSRLDDAIEFVKNGVKYKFNLFAKMGLAVLKACDRIVDCTDENFRRYPLLNVSWDDLWLESRIGKPVLSKNHCVFALNESDCKRNFESGNSLNLHFSSQPLATGGKCVKITQVDEFLYNSFSKNLELSFNDSSSKILTIKFFDNKPLNTDDGLEIIELNSEVVITNVKKFRYINTETNPCLPTEEYTKCLEEKMDEIVKMADLCYLPMLKSSLNSRNCTSFDESLTNVMKYMQTLAFNNSKATCIRSCVDTIVKFDIFQNRVDNTSIVIHLKSNIIEEYIDVHAYGLTMFLSDLAGTAGFFLGMSLIHVINKPLLVLTNKFF